VQGSSPCSRWLAGRRRNEDKGPQSEIQGKAMLSARRDPGIGENEGGKRKVRGGAEERRVSVKKRPEGQLRGLSESHGAPEKGSREKT